MAGKQPFFLTGANAKLIVNNKVMAFATDVTYSITVRHAAPHICGMYEPVELTPLTYEVTGSFTVIRYAKDLKDANAPTNASKKDSGNGIGNWGESSVLEKSTTAVGIPIPAGFASDGRAQQALNPRLLHQSVMFDMEIQQLRRKGFTRTETIVSTINKQNISRKSSQIKNIVVARIRNCRIENATFEVSKKGAAVERFTFKALYVDEDSFTADFSGTGQNLV